jgi:PAS domain S-box-containing protein
VLEAKLTAATLLGVARNALVGEKFSRFIHNEDQDVIFRYLRLLFETGERQECELRIAVKDGTAFWAWLNGTIAWDTQARMGHIVLSDISERKRQAEAHHNIVAELAGAAAHELNQPLTSVLGYAELLQRRLEPSSPLYPAVMVIVAGAERMAETVRKEFPQNRN